MTLRLLPKREIDRLKSSEKAREINEGKKLAEQVDRLRQLKPQEEAALLTFRNETLANIHAEITEETAKRDTLKTEVRDLEECREVALKPLTEEFSRIESERKDLESFSSELDRRESGIEEERKRTVAESRLAQVEKQRAATERERSDRELERAAADREKAQTALHEARSLRTESARLKKEVENDLLLRDQQMAAREVSLALKEESNEREKQAIIKEWKLLEDRKQMFERSVKRQQHGT